MTQVDPIQQGFVVHEGRLYRVEGCLGDYHFTEITEHAPWSDSEDNGGDSA